jgi:hypothetical protein
MEQIGQEGSDEGAMYMACGGEVHDRKTQIEVK